MFFEREETGVKERWSGQRQLLIQMSLARRLKEDENQR